MPDLTQPENGTASTDSGPKYADAVLQGGGVRGIGHVGALLVAEQQGYQWVNIAGTSAGAIVASMLAVGYKATELYDIMKDINYRRFADSLGFGRYFGKSVFNLIFRGGIHSGNYVEDFVREKLRAKGKQKFGDLPHKIFGRQTERLNDPHILPYLPDHQLFELYAEAPVFVYPSTETRHIHYSPVEAMVVGTPVLYRRGALSDVLAGGADLAGACATTDEMRDKARRLLAGDRELADSIRATQGRIVDTFAVDLARKQWAEVLDRDLASSASAAQEPSTPHRSAIQVRSCRSLVIDTTNHINIFQSIC